MSAIPPPAEPLVGLRVDARPEIGVGHAVRCLALAQELRHRGVAVEAYGELSVPWVARDYTELGIAIRPADSLDASPVTHAVLDGYEIPASIGTALRRKGVRTLAMVDGPFGAHQPADVYVDQNYGATPADLTAADRTGSAAVAGIDYALFRDNVLRARALPRPSSERPRVLVVFGGTDPLRACPDHAHLLLATGLPVEVVAVAADADIERRLRDLQPGADQTVVVEPPPADLPALAAGCDAAVSAAGSTIWELLTIGVPTASVCVIDNQEPGYVTTVRDGVVLPGGRLARLRTSDDAERVAVATALRRLIADDNGIRRRLLEHGRALVDGRGRERVADLLLATP